jgi:hypothetical protein
MSTEQVRQNAHQCDAPGSLHQLPAPASVPCPHSVNLVVGQAKVEQFVCGLLVAFEH